MTARILTNDDLRHIEAQHAAATPPLMQRAGTAAASVAREMLAPGGTPLIVAGPGNNGGDAFVVACELRDAGIVPAVLFAGDPARLPPDARQAHADWLAGGGQCLTTYPEETFALIIDGLFGIGLARPVAGLYAEWIARINTSATPVLALDIPSGLNADTGTANGPCVRACRTATFIALKPGLLTADGPDHCGEITLCPLGLDAGNAGGQLIAPDLFAPYCAPRPRNSHKGSFGSVAVLGGAPGMAGAVLLEGRAALKLGAGRVYVGMLERLAVDPLQPELMLRTPEEAVSMATVLAVGPGLGQSHAAHTLLVQAIDSPLPLVLDADALNLLAANPDLQKRLAARPVSVSPASTIGVLLTPHPAEAARLLGIATEQVQADRRTAALELARRFNAGIALKGCGTVIAMPDGQWFINTTGNPGLASAGSGDVLTGLLAALLAQDWPPLAALLAAVHLHGAAADICVTSGYGPTGLTAGELIDPARTLFNRWLRLPGADTDTAY